MTGETVVRLRLADLGWVLVGGVLAVWAVQSLWWPLEGDNGFWMWGGEVISHGGLPYRDAFDVKGPLPYLIGALTFNLFGRNQWGLRVVDLVILAGACLALRRSGGWSAVFFLALWYGAQGPWRTAQADGWASAALAMGFLPLLLSPASGRTIALAGLAVGIALLVKPTYGAMLIVPAAAIWMDRPPWWPKAAAVFSVLAPAALVSLWLYSLGGFWEFIEAYVRYPLAVYRVADETTDRFLPFRFLFGFPVGVAMPLAMAGAVWTWQRDRRWALLVLGWLGAGILGVVVQGRYWQYHWLPVLPPVALLSARGIEGATASAPSLRRLGLLATILAFVAAAATPANQVRLWAMIQAGALPPSAFPSSLPGAYGRGPESVTGVASYVREHTGEEDLVLAWSNLVVVNYLSGRMSPTRFGLARALVDGGDNPYRRRYRSEFLASIEQHPPAYVVTYSDAYCRTAPAPESYVGRMCLADFPEFSARLSDHYKLEWEGVTYAILRLSET